MADDQTQQEKNQGKIDVVPEVKPNAEPEKYGEYLQLNKDKKEQLQKYGYTDVQQFLTMVGSHGDFAQKVVSDLMGLAPETPFSAAKEAFSSQESNQTGLIDNTDPMLKVKTPRGSEPVTTVA